MTCMYAIPWHDESKPISNQLSFLTIVIVKENISFHASLQYDVAN